jgi:putative colanic acid biosynthesis glycosyltransferase
MNVLQVNTVYPNGSTGRIASEIAAYTAMQPDAHAFAAFGIGEPEKQENVTALRIGTPLERKVHGALRKLFDAEGYGSLAATKQLIRFCEENHIDVVHLHNLHGCYLNLKRWFRYLKEKNLPVIWTLHDCWPLTGHCAHFDYCGCNKWKTLCRRCPQKKYYPQCIGIGGSKRNYRFKRRLFTSLENLTVVTPCRWLEGIVKQSFLKNTPIRVIYNGVDTRQFLPSASDIRMQYGLKDKQVLLAVALVWNNRKGLKAIAELSRMLDERYRIVIVGLSPEQIRTLPENMVGLGQISDPTMLCAWYGAADCFVNPT